MPCLNAEPHVPQRAGKRQRAKGKRQRRPSLDGVRYMTTTKILERSGMEESQTSWQPIMQPGGRESELCIEEGSYLIGAEPEMI